MSPTYLSPTYLSLSSRSHLAYPTSSMYVYDYGHIYIYRERACARGSEKDSKGEEERKWKRERESSEKGGETVEGGRGEGGRELQGK